MSFSLAEKGAGKEISVRQPPSQEIMKRLLDALLSGSVAPGSRIPSERTLAEELNVGRGMMREAIKSLSMLGLLEQKVGDGTYLSKSSSDLLPQVIEWGLLLGEKRFDDLLEARFILEVQLAGLAATRRTPEQLATIQALAEMMRLPRMTSTPMSRQTSPFIWRSPVPVTTRFSAGSWRISGRFCRPGPRGC